MLPIGCLHTTSAAALSAAEGKLSKPVSTAKAAGARGGAMTKRARRPATKKAAEAAEDEDAEAEAPVPVTVADEHLDMSDEEEEEELAVVVSKKAPKKPAPRITKKAPAKTKAKANDDAPAKRGAAKRTRLTKVADWEEGAAPVAVTVADEHQADSDDDDGMVMHEQGGKAKAEEAVAAPVVRRIPKRIISSAARTAAAEKEAEREATALRAKQEHETSLAAAPITVDDLPAAFNPPNVGQVYLRRAVLEEIATRPKVNQVRDLSALWWGPAPSAHSRQHNIPLHSPCYGVHGAPEMRMVFARPGSWLQRIFVGTQHLPMHAEALQTLTAPSHPSLHLQPAAAAAPPAPYPYTPFCV